MLTHTIPLVSSLALVLEDTFGNPDSQHCTLDKEVHRVKVALQY